MQMANEMWHWFVFGFSAGFGFAIATWLFAKLVSKP